MSYAPFTSNCTDSNPEICGCVGNYYVCENEYINQYDSDCYHDDLNPECRPFISPDVPGPSIIPNLNHEDDEFEFDDHEGDDSLGKPRHSNVGVSYSCPSHNPPKCKCWVRWNVCLYEFMNVFDQSCYQRSLNKECHFTAEILGNVHKKNNPKAQISPPSNNDNNNLGPFSNKTTNNSEDYASYGSFIIVMIALILLIISCVFIHRKFCYKYDDLNDNRYASNLYDIRLDHNGEILLDDNSIPEDEIKITEN